MAKLLLITFIFLQIGVYLNYGIKLTPICKNSTFQYIGHHNINTTVNSVYKLKFIRDYKMIQDHLIDENINYHFYFTNETAIKMNEIRKEYNDKIIEIYSHQYINGLNKNYDKEYDLLFDLYFDTNPFLFQCFLVNKKNFAIQTREKMVNGFGFARSLKYYINNQSFNPFNATHDKIELERLIRSINLKDNQILSIEYDPIDVIFYHKILSFNRFYFNRFSKVLFDSKSSGKLVMDIVLPIFDPNYNETDSNCLTSDDLPGFYKKYLKN